MPIALISTWNSISQNRISLLVLLLITEVLLLAVFLALDVLLFYIFFESILIPLFLLIGLFGSSNKVKASFYLFLYTLAGSLFLLLAILTINSIMGTTDYDAIFKTNFSYSLQVFLFIGAMFSFFIKTPVYFFNIWLLKAHVESPLVGSIVLAAIVLKLSLYGECVLAILVKIQLSNNKINNRTTIIISKILYTFNYNSAIPHPVNSIKGKYTIRVQRIFLSSSSLKLRKLPLQLSNKPSSTWPLDPFFVTGFSDAEGCFYVTVTKNKSSKLGWTVQPAYSIELHKRDIAILEDINNFFGVGNISENGPNANSTSATQLQNSISASRNYSTLATQKCSEENFKLNPWWLSGFIDGEGCFHVSITPRNNRKLGWEVKPSFHIRLHRKDQPVLDKICKLLKVGCIYEKGPSAVEFNVKSFQDLESVINHFDKYPLLTKKRADFDLLKKVLILMKRKEHLTAPPRGGGGFA